MGEAQLGAQYKGKNMRYHTKRWNDSFIKKSSNCLRTHTRPLVRAIQIKSHFKNDFGEIMVMQFMFEMFS
jgi:hypothetical protein